MTPTDLSSLSPKPASVSCTLYIGGALATIRFAKADMAVADALLHWLTATWWRRHTRTYRWADDQGHFFSVRCSRIDGWFWTPVVESSPAVDPLKAKIETLVDESLAAQREVRKKMNEGEEWRNS